MTHPSEDMTGSEDVRRAAAGVSNRLESLGIWLSGAEQPEELADIAEAVERFELAVKARGGDLMVDEPPEGRRPQPDEIRFALPRRHADESVERYITRLKVAREEVLIQPPRQ
jgi:hypothetical protein